MEDARVVPAAPMFSSLAIFSLIFAVFAWTILPVLGLATAGFSIFNMIAMPLSGSVIASVCAKLARRRIRRSGGALRGAGLAQAALIMAYSQYALFGLVLVFMVTSMGSHAISVQVPGKL